MDNLIKKSRKSKIEVRSNIDNKLIIDNQFDAQSKIEFQENIIQHSNRKSNVRIDTENIGHHENRYKLNSLDGTSCSIFEESEFREHPSSYIPLELTTLYIIIKKYLLIEIIRCFYMLALSISIRDSKYISKTSNGWMMMDVQYIR